MNQHLSNIISSKCKMQSAKLQLAIQSYFLKTFNFKLQLLTFNFELLTSKGFQAGFIKLTKKTLILLLAFIILLPSLSWLVLFKLPKKAQAEWYDEGWSYRTSYSINNTGAAVTNQKIKLDIDTATLYTNGKIKINCDDSRFTDQNGNLLDYFIDTNEAGCNNASTDYYVILPTINSGRTIIYHYYGNPQATRGRKDDFLPPSSAPTLGVGLKGYWKLDESSGTRSDYAHTNNLTDNNTVTQATGKVGNAGQFTAANSEYLSITDNADLSTGDVAFTTAAWVYADSFSNAPNIISKMDTNVAREYRLNTDFSNYPALLVSRDGGGGGSYTTVTATTALSTGSWHLILTWHDPDTDTLNIQVDNGTPASATHTGGVYDGGNPFLIGAIYSSSSTTAYWNGRIDGVGFWKKVLTAAERTALYNGGNGVDFDSVLTFSPASTTAAAEEKGPGPVAYWKFDDPSTSSGQVAQDSTTNNNDGTLGATSGSSTDDPSWQTEDMCVAGKCLKFDGSDDYVNSGSGSSIDDITVKTISLWMKPTGSSESDAGRLLDKAQGTNGWILIYDSADDSIELYQNFSTTHGQWSTPNSLVLDNKWYHVAVNYNNSSTSNTPSIYINGVLQTLSVISNPQGSAVSDASTTLTIGDRTANDRAFNGFIDDVKIYNYARTAAQIQADYAARGTSKGASAVLGQSSWSGAIGSPSFLSNGLVGYWKMDEASWNGTASEVVDASGNGSHGIASCTGVGCTVPSTAVGKYGNGGSFDNSAARYISGPTGGSLSFTTGSFTLSAWVKKNAGEPANGNWIISKGVPGNTNGVGYEFYYEPRSIFTRGIVLIINDSTKIESFKVSADITDQQWHHVAGVINRNINQLSIFLDGVFQGSQATTITGSLSSSSTFYISTRADRGATQTFDGSLDEARIYNRALSPKEVEALYNFAPGPKVYLKMDEGTGTAANDSSGNANTGTVNSGTWTTGKYGKGVSVSGSTGSNVSVPDFGY